MSKAKPRYSFTAETGAACATSICLNLEEAIGLLSLFNTAAVYDGSEGNGGTVHIDSAAFTTATKIMKNALYNAHCSADSFLADYLPRKDYGA